jgi:S1-C subfamily serine protease
VVVRRGASQGSGTIIASVPGATLVLTAAHVVSGQGAIVVELHRYNLGLEHTAPGSGWPRKVSAGLAAADAAADLAVIRIDQYGALPNVARLGRGAGAVPDDTIVTSLGIDLGSELAAWNARVVETLTFAMEESSSSRPFLITDRIPERGRSGGGLFLPSGELVGVCIGHAEITQGQRMGVFASRESVRRLLSDSRLSPTILRSELRRSRGVGR